MESSERRRWKAAALGLAVLGLPSLALAAELNLTPNLPILLGNIAVFALLVYPTSRMLLQPLTRILEERERRTEGAIGEAETITREAAEARARLAARLREAAAAAQALRAEIAAEADRDQREILEAARAEATRDVEGVRESISADLDTARQSLRDEARTLAAQAAAQILGRPL